MPIFSGALDFLLGLACLAIARGCMRLGNDFLFAGFLWVASAALVGAFRLGGVEQLADAHSWLAEVSKGIGMLSMGLGIAAAIFGPWPISRWAAPALSIVGVGVDRLFLVWPSGKPLVQAIGAVSFLGGLVLLAGTAAARGRFSAALAAVGSLASILVVGFGMNKIPLSAEGWFRPVDLIHVLLTTCYGLLWWSILRTTAGRVSNVPSS